MIVFLVESTVCVTCRTIEGYRPFRGCYLAIFWLSAGYEILYETVYFFVCVVHSF